MSIPFLDLAASQAEIHVALEEAMQRTLRSGSYVLSEEVASFEAEFAAYCGATGCAGVASGVDALELILRAMDIGPGDEVIVPSNTYIATWLAVSRAGATPGWRHEPSGSVEEVPDIVRSTGARVHLGQPLCIAVTAPSTLA